MVTHAATRGAAAAALLALVLLSQPSTAGDRVCDLPPDAGPCDGICPRWFFNGQTGQCEEFIWGCCGGNANNFETLEACQAACGKEPCPADIDGDGAVAVGDLLALLAAWGDTGGPADINGDGQVDIADLLGLLGSWGPCA